MRAEAEALLASLEIDDLAADQIVGALSVGHRQRVEILRALSHDARILIMDEPTAALTESDVARLFGIVRKLKSRGVGIVYISHRLDELFEIADRVTVLRDGAYVGSRAMAETSAAELVQMMVGRRIETLFPKTAVADRRAGARGARSRPPADDPERQPDRARRRDRRPRRAGRLRAQRARPGPVRDHAGRARRRSADGRGCDDRLARERPRSAGSPTCRRTAESRASSGR